MKGSLQRSPTESPKLHELLSHEYRISHCSSHEVAIDPSASESQLVSQMLMGDSGQ